MPPEASSPWASVHLYFEGALFEDTCDEVLRCVAWPMVRACQAEGLVSESFFVRYADPDSHVRLRLLRTEGSATRDIEHCVQAFLSQCTATSVHARWTPYEPEVERYGGVPAMNANEKLFVASSTQAEKTIEALPAHDRATRIGRALTAQLDHLHAFLPEREEALKYLTTTVGANIAAIRDEEVRGRLVGQFGAAFGRQADALRAAVIAIWGELNHASGGRGHNARHANDPHPAGELRTLWDRGALFASDDRLRGSWTRCARRLLASHIHMSNNRHGLTRIEEVYTGYLLRRSFGSLEWMPTS